MLSFRENSSPGLLQTTKQTGALFNSKRPFRDLVDSRPSYRAMKEAHLIDAITSANSTMGRDDGIVIFILDLVPLNTLLFLRKFPYRDEERKRREISLLDARA